MLKNYNSFLESPCQSQWSHIGAQRRAGVLVPLFSLYSDSSIGVGEIPDLNWLVDWCAATGLSIIQLLPMNDTGFNFRPYDSESSFALEPMHLSLDEIAGVHVRDFRSQIAALRNLFPCRAPFFDTSVKRAKLDLLFKMFLRRSVAEDAGLRVFFEENRFWLEPYTQFKVIKEKLGNAGWIDWPDPWKLRDADALTNLQKECSDRLLFQAWLQWQLAIQFSRAKEYATKKGVLFFGDIPFLVSRDSADVWSNPGDFKLDLSSGAPPDLYFAEGQEWGMPPYHWTNIASADYRYLTQKLRYAEKFYDLFRIDHFVGVFRVWTFHRGLPDAERRQTGAFDSPDESLWEAQGRRIVDVMAQCTSMMPCAEDLGCVPDCSPKILKEYSIPGMEIQRWMRHWDTTKEFKTADEYRPNAIATISTHDMSPLLLWWKNEAGTEEDRRFFWRSIGLSGEPETQVSRKFVEACLKTVHATDSIFSIQLIHDWLALTDILDTDGEDQRINLPGIVNDTNWRLRLPLSVEELVRYEKLNKKIFTINDEAKRVPVKS